MGEKCVIRGPTKNLSSSFHIKLKRDSVTMKKELLEWSEKRVSN